MDLALTEEQEMLKTAVRRFVQQEYPKEVLLDLAASGRPVPSADRCCGTSNDPRSPA